MNSLADEGLAQDEDGTPTQDPAHYIRLGIERARRDGALTKEVAEQELAEVARQTPTMSRVKRAEVTENRRIANFDDWIGVAAELREILMDMRRQPRRYTRAERLVVQLAVAVVTDPDAAIREKQLAVSQAMKQFGTSVNSRNRDDPSLPPDGLLEHAEREVKGTSTQDLLAMVKGPEVAPEATPDVDRPASES